DLKKALEYCDQGIKLAPDSEGGINCQALRTAILTKTHSFTLEKANIPGQPFQALVTYKNLGNMYWRVVKLTEEIRIKSQKLDYDDGQTAVLEYYASLPYVQEWKVNLPDDGDYQTHSTEILIPALEAGHYLILASNKPDFVSHQNALFYTSVWISNISFINAMDQTTGDMHYWVTHRDKGEPLSGVKGIVYKKEWNYKLRKYIFHKKDTYVSDKKGRFTVKFKGDNHEFSVKFLYQQEELFMDDEFYQYHSYDHSGLGYQTHFFTDRAIYRPGQTIYYKGILVQSNSKHGVEKKVARGYKTTVVFYDVNGEEISRQKVKTNEYGTFSGKFVAPTDRLNGQMSIGNEFNRQYFSVEEYKRPQFEVLFDPVKEEYQLNDQIEITGKALAFAGFPVDNSEVKFRVVRETYFPYWYWWWGGYPSNTNVEIKNGQLKTNDQGEFTIEFKAMPDLSVDPERKPVFRYAVYADVTDINGETHSAVSSIRIGYVSLQLAISCPEKMAKEQKYQLNISSNNLNNVYVPSKGEITISRLKSPEKIFRNKYWNPPDRFIMSNDDYHSAFPYDAYQKEDLFYTWDKEKVQFTTRFNTEKSKQLVLDNLSDWKPGKYILEMTAKDKKGEQVKVFHYFTLYSEQSNQLPLKESIWFSPLKTICQPGDIAQIEVGTAEDFLFVFYEVLVKDEVVKSELVKLENERKILEFPVTEKHRGNFTVQLNMVKHNRAYTFTQPITVAWKNKDLKIDFETFRNKLLPGTEEQWRLKISGPEGERVAAEMVATLFDASLEEFVSHNWYMSLFPYFYPNRGWENYRSFNSLNSQTANWDWNEDDSYYSRYYDQINYYGFSFAYYHYGLKSKKRSQKQDLDLVMLSEESYREGEAPEVEMKQPMQAPDAEDRSEPPSPPIRDDEVATTLEKDTNKETKEIQIRKNLAETAFFFPHLTTDKEGKIIINFTIPEALTRWKMIGMAHTKDLKSAVVYNHLVTQKDLMIIPNVPRFLRENDQITLTAKVTNLSDKVLKGQADLYLFDALTMEPIAAKFKLNHSSQDFTSQAGQSALVEWALTIPEGVQAVTYRVIAKAESFSDGQEAVIPILTNRMLVTESLPLPIRGKEEKTFQFNKLIDSNKSDTLAHHRLTLEFTSHPAWYAVQALPYMMEFPYECSEQVFSRYYANSIASYIANSSPKIKNVFESWKGTDALKSNLEKNEELKSLLLQETPWVLQARDEGERKKRLGLLFDLFRMNKELNKAFQKLKKMQSSNGGWPWFPGLPDNRYITQHILAGLGHLDKLGIKEIKDKADSKK
ncbi:MAG: MG2 domain-containing protein, partial [Spirochaetes bacterium]|nr:MG2 domain-containing protein [Spirochaetota bacterium]